MKEKLKILRLGLSPYQETWDLQTSIHKALIANRDQPLTDELTHTLILCQHPHVYTLGKSGSEDHLLADQLMLRNIDAEFHKINRGGDITYHGPGQLVAYPILDLNRLFNDVHKYVRLLEECIIQVLGMYGLDGLRIKEYTGVWLEHNLAMPHKICAIGVHLSRWVSLHGLAFNVSTDLNYFNHIIPCGIPSKDKSVISLEKALNRSINFEQIENQFIDQFVHLFDFDILKIDNENSEKN